MTIRFELNRCWPARPSPSASATGPTNADVYALQGLTYRDLDGTEPRRIGDDDSDRQAWKADVIAPDGVEYEVNVSPSGECSTSAPDD